MAELVKGLTRWIVVPLCIGSNPIFRPRMEKSRIDFKIEIDSYESIFLLLERNW